MAAATTSDNDVTVADQASRENSHDCGPRQLPQISENAENHQSSQVDEETVHRETLSKEASGCPIASHQSHGKSPRATSDKENTTGISLARQPSLSSDGKEHDSACGPQVKMRDSRDLPHGHDVLPVAIEGRNSKSPSLVPTPQESVLLQRQELNGKEPVDSGEHKCDASPPSRVPQGAWLWQRLWGRSDEDDAAKKAEQEAKEKLEEKSPEQEKVDQWASSVRNISDTAALHDLVINTARESLQWKQKCSSLMAATHKMEKEHNDDKKAWSADAQCLNFTIKLLASMLAALFLYTLVRYTTMTYELEEAHAVSWEAAHQLRWIIEPAFKNGSVWTLPVMTASAKTPTFLPPGLTTRQHNDTDFVRIDFAKPATEADIPLYEQADKEREEYFHKSFEEEDLYYVPGRETPPKKKRATLDLDVFTTENY